MTPVMAELMAKLEATKPPPRTLAQQRADHEAWAAEERARAVAHHGRQQAAWVWPSPHRSLAWHKAEAEKRIASNAWMLDLMEREGRA